MWLLESCSSIALLYWMWWLHVVCHGFSPVCFLFCLSRANGVLLVSHTKVGNLCFLQVSCRASTELLLKEYIVSCYKLVCTRKGIDAMMIMMISHFMATGGSWFCVGAWNRKCEGCPSQLSWSVYRNSVHSMNCQINVKCNVSSHQLRSFWPFTTLCSRHHVCSNDFIDTLNCSVWTRRTCVPTYNRGLGQASPADSFRILCCPYWFRIVIVDFLREKWSLLYKHKVQCILSSTQRFLNIYNAMSYLRSDEDYMMMESCVNFRMTLKAIMIFSWRQVLTPWGSIK